jgi:sugar phosphate isomerase/epimerase
VAVRIGNAAAPRWFDCSLDRLDEYIVFLQACGATSTELVLHHGPADDWIARGHVLEADWFPVIGRFQDAGIVCHVHAPLHPRFGFDRWTNDPLLSASEWRPLLRVLVQLAERQREPTTLVVHAASSNSDEGTRATVEALHWLLAELGGLSENVRIGIELRRPASPDDARIDRSRESLVAFVARQRDKRVGICWDIANDWQSATMRALPLTVPDSSFLRLVNHVHLHDAGAPDEVVHHPLSLERVPWRPMLGALIGQGFAGAVTMEIRYRHALDRGKPWPVLADSYRRLRSFLNVPDDE